MKHIPVCCATTSVLFSEKQHRNSGAAFLYKKPIKILELNGC